MAAIFVKDSKTDMIEFKIESAEIEKSFNAISEILLNQLILVSGNRKYRFTEIEFYYFNELNHADPYSHKHILQLESNCWYFHPSGLDITLGDGKNYCGILIRRIIDITNNVETYGPLNVVREMFKNISSTQPQHYYFGLERNQLEQMKIIRTKRVGILRDKSPEYFEKNYRYLIYPEKKHKNKFDYQKA
ncbi:MAG: hypothetical protein IM618_16155 [Cytophagales bacterium]|nr:hypothetical protein [Cytophagales bacterium]